MQSEVEYKKYLRIVLLRKELFVGLALVIMTVVFAASFILPRSYQSSSTVFIEKNVISELVRGITVTPSMEDTLSVLTYAITSRTMLTKVADALDLNVNKSDAATDALVKKLARNTTVRVKDRNLFTISFVDENPRLARDFVNTLVRLYIEENVSSKRGESYDATNFLTEQIDTFNKKLEKAEAQVNDYKRAKGGVISIDEGRLFQEINTAQQKLYDLQLRRRQLEGMRLVTRKSNDPLQAKLSHLQKRLDDLLVQYTDSYPEVLSVKGDIEEVREQMRQRKGGEMQPLDPQELAKIESEIEAIKVTESGLNRYIATNRGLLQTIPSAKAGLEKLELEKRNQKNLYDQLFARQGQSEVSKQMQVQDKSTTFRVVDPAVLPLKPVSPNRLKIMMMGIFAGIGGSLALLLLIDQLDGSVKDISFVRGLGAPVLAVVPRMKDPRQEARERRRSLGVLSAAALYFLVLLTFPAMELMGLPYMDHLLDRVNLTHLSGGR